MENLVIQAKRKFTLDKYVSSVKVSATNDIKSILNVSAKSVISLVEQAGNIVTCSGKVVLNVLYLNQENQIEKVCFEFNDKNLVTEIILDKGKRFNIKEEFVEKHEIENITYYILDMPDVNYTQIYFIYDECWYMFRYTNKQELTKIISNLKELEKWKLRVCLQ